RSDPREQVPAAHGVTVVTNGLRELLQETAESASLRRKGITMAGHLSWLAQRPTDCERLIDAKRWSPTDFHCLLQDMYQERKRVELKIYRSGGFVMPKYLPSS